MENSFTVFENFQLFCLALFVVTAVIRPFFALTLPIAKLMTWIPLRKANLHAASMFNTIIYH